MKTKIFYFLTLWSFFLLSACSSNQAVAQRRAQVTTVVYVKKTPPKPKYERVKKCHRHNIWIKGHWKWNGHIFVWVKGHCVKKRRGMVWVPGHWKHTPHGWRWIPGHWR